MNIKAINIHQTNINIQVTNIDILECSLKIESTGLRLKITVAVDLQARVLENRRVVSPAGRWQVDFFVTGPEWVEEGTADSQCTGSTDRLNGSHRWWGYFILVLTQRQCSRQFGEFGITSDCGVFFVQFGIGNVFLRLFGRKYAMKFYHQ